MILRDSAGYICNSSYSWISSALGNFPFLHFPQCCQNNFVFFIHCKRFSGKCTEPVSAPLNPAGRRRIPWQMSYSQSSHNKRQANRTAHIYRIFDALAGVCVWTSRPEVIISKKSAPFPGHCAHRAIMIRVLRCCRLFSRFQSCRRNRRRRSLPRSGRRGLPSARWRNRPGQG